MTIVVSARVPFPQPIIPSGARDPWLFDGERSLAPLGMTEGWLRDAPQHEAGVHLLATAVHAPAREASRALARNSLRCRRAGVLYQSSRGGVLSSPETHEFHEAHEESAPMPMASGSEVIPHES